MDGHERERETERWWEGAQKMHTPSSFKPIELRRLNSFSVLILCNKIVCELLFSSWFQSPLTANIKTHRSNIQTVRSNNICLFNWLVVLMFLFIFQASIKLCHSKASLLPVKFKCSCLPFNYVRPNWKSQASHCFRLRFWLCRCCCRRARVFHDGHAPNINSSRVAHVK